MDKGREAMGRLLFADKGNEAASRKLRRQAAAGKIGQLAPGVFISPEGESVERITQREWHKLVGYLFPGGVVTDRTGMESMPHKDDLGVAHVFVSAPKSNQVVKLPGLIINQREGAGPIQNEDVPFMDTVIAGPTRRILDNLVVSRSRSGPSRTVGPEEVELHLEKLCSAQGESVLNELRDNARAISALALREKEAAKLDQMVGTLLGSRKSKLMTAPGIARASGRPIDTECLSRLQNLYGYLLLNPTPEVIDPNISRESKANACFVEAYFSNYIEGTRFLIDEAKEIVFDGRIPQERPEDGHDVLATYLKLMEPPRPHLDKLTPEQFLLTLQLDHNDILRQRPTLNPGQFKSKGNAAGNTVFVSPEKVQGTLQEGFTLLRTSSDPMSRAVMAHFLVSDVHPFNDGNGRLSRITMSRELTSNSLSHAVIPTVFRNDYLDALRAMTRRNDPETLVRSLSHCQKISAACSSDDLQETVALWASTYAFLEEGRHASLQYPANPNDVELKNGIPAPRRYWEVEGNEGGGIPEIFGPR